MRKHGALDIYAGVTHGVFCPGAFERLAESPIKEIVVTDTLQHEPGIAAGADARAVGGGPARGGRAAHPRGTLAQFAVRLIAPSARAFVATGPGRRPGSTCQQEEIHVVGHPVEGHAPDQAGQGRRPQGARGRPDPGCAVRARRGRRCRSRSRRASSRPRCAATRAATPSSTCKLGRRASITALVRDVQYDPLSHAILHLDFQHISLTETDRGRGRGARRSASPRASRTAAASSRRSSARSRCAACRPRSRTGIDVDVTRAADRRARCTCATSRPRASTILTDPDVDGDRPSWRRRSRRSRGGRRAVATAPAHGGTRSGRREGQEGRDGAEAAEGEEGDKEARTKDKK